MGLVFVPVYIHFIGIEAYGLIGIYATLMGVFSLLDFGLGATINREMARRSVRDGNACDMRDLLRTLEIPYWGIAVLIGLSVIALSKVIAFHWVQTKELSPLSVQKAIIIMGAATAFQWPMALYVGGLRGLQHQVLLNAIDAVMATCRGIGAVLVLWAVSPTLEAFFLWQVVISATHTALMAGCLWRSLPKASQPPNFRWRYFLELWRFAVTIAGTSVVTTILRQADKVILSRMLSLEVFGYYSLANVVAMNMSRFSGPVIKAVYPRLTSIVALGSTTEIASLYHKSTQAISVLILPVTIVLTIYSQPILLLWTRDPVIAANSYMLVNILVAGTALNSLMYTPYALQLAFGWTTLGFWVNLFSVFLIVPLTILLTHHYGAIGAASSWVILNGGFLVIAVQIMHQKLLPQEKWRWYGMDIGLPLMAALLSAGLFRLVAPLPDNEIGRCLYIALASGVTLGATALSASVTRTWFHAKLTVWRAV